MRYSGGGRMSAVRSLATSARSTATPLLCSPHQDAAVSSMAATMPDRINDVRTWRTDFISGLAGSTRPSRGVLWYRTAGVAG